MKTTIQKTRQGVTITQGNKVIGYAELATVYDATIISPTCIRGVLSEVYGFRPYNNRTPITSYFGENGTQRTAVIDGKLVDDFGNFVTTVKVATMFCMYGSVRITLS
jgi:hypothetical protein